MTTLICYREGVNTWSIRCSNCHTEVSLLTVSELTSFQAYLHRTGEPVLCFDCDNVSTDIVPRGVYKLLANLGLPGNEGDYPMSEEIDYDEVDEYNELFERLMNLLGRRELLERFMSYDPASDHLEARLQEIRRTINLINARLMEIEEANDVG